jgi:hypothetical protein
MANNPKGVVILTEEPHHMQIVHTTDGDELRIVGYDYVLSLHAIGEIEGSRFYEYTLRP